MEPEQNAQRESLYREVNERIVELSRSLSLPAIELLCECGRGCLERLELPLAVYQRVRRSGTLFALVPGHEDLDVERAVEQLGPCLIVEKTGLAGEIARRNYRGVSAA